MNSDNGEAFTFGKGGQFQLGHGGSKDELKPRIVESLKNVFIQKIGCGDSITVACAGILTNIP
jgi:alpha-tubulin suppressor-like RCC1 family protein